MCIICATEDNDTYTLLDCERGLELYKNVEQFWNYFALCVNSDRTFLLHPPTAAGDDEEAEQNCGKSEYTLTRS